MVNWSAVNFTEALKTIRNFNSNFNWSFNLSVYPKIENFTKLNMTDTQNTTRYFFTGISDYWLAVMGSWFYVFLIYFTCGLIYVKSKSIFPTSLAMLLMSILVAAPATAGTFYVPVEVLIVLYVSLVLAFAGVLYSLFVGRSR